MEAPEYDLIVVGGSSSGSQVAHTASKLGLNVAVVEEHPKTGLPEHCSGLFSYWGLEAIDSMPPKDLVFNYDVYGSQIIAPNGKILTVKKPEPHAIVCDRAAFDRFLLGRAVESGTTLFQPFRAMEAIRRQNSVEVKIRSSSGEQISLTGKMVVSAEGIRGNIAQQLGLQGPPKDRFVYAAQFYMDDLEGVDHQLVEVYQTHTYAPDFFAWLIPMSDQSAKIGLGTSRPAAGKQLEAFVKDHPVMKEKTIHADHTRTTAGRIPTTGPVKRTFADRTMLVGDVAGQTKPTTGGGVILGGIAAQIAGQVAYEAVQHDRFDAKFLAKYQTQWRKEMLSNLKRMRLVREYMNRLQDGEVDHFFSMLEQKGIATDIENIGHVDDQGKLVRKFMVTWSLYPFYLKTSPRLLNSVFQSLF